MSASLVGSEMCIRDRPKPPPTHQLKSASAGSFCLQRNPARAAQLGDSGPNTAGPDRTLGAQGSCTG
eukprot:13001760-Alexandrium_andersonii.AAC.1